MMKEVVMCYAVRGGGRGMAWDSEKWTHEERVEWTDRHNQQEEDAPQRNFRYKLEFVEFNDEI